MALLRINNAFKSQPIWQQILYVLIFNTTIAIFLHAIIPNSILYNQLLLSQSIGISILFSFILLGQFFELKNWKVIIPLFIGSLTGILIAIIIQALTLQAELKDVVEAIRKNYSNILTTLLIALFFGSIIVAFFVYREHIHRKKSELQNEKINNLDQQKAIAETNLRLLQAQIEPHFLFNTLSNVISLIETEPEKSKYLLESLTEFLRSSLKRSSDAQQDLQHEINLIHHYLEIMKIRFGTRLDYNIQLQENLAACNFPPLLIQPLVENAISHGIEPVSEGGRIDISIKKIDDRLIINVSDTGKGLTDKPVTGFGLSNIRARLQSLYRNDGHLYIEENSPSGVSATIEVPYEPV